MSLLRSSVLLLILISTVPGKAQEKILGTDYREIFKEDYNYALKLIDQNAWWSDTLQSHGLDPEFALSIIFPELVRYSSILDYIEVRGLEVLYVQYGKDYADFSIGYFQMKPSFAEKVEENILGLHLIKSYPDLAKLKPNITKSTEVRKARIIRLKDEYCQLLYLEAFLRIMEEIYPHISGNPDTEKLAFYSTAYNFGYYKDEEVILEEMKKNRFYCSLNPESNKYSYAEISTGYFLEIREK